MTRARREHPDAFTEFPTDHAKPTREPGGGHQATCSAPKTERPAKNNTAGHPDAKDEGRTTEMRPISMRMAPLPSNTKRRPEHAGYYLILKPAPPAHLGQDKAASHRHA